MKENKQIIMKSLIVLFLFVSVLGYSQSNSFNTAEYKLVKVSIGNLSSKEQAMFISSVTEKNLMSELSWVDISTGTGYFIVKKNNIAANIELIIKSLNGLSCSNTQELTLDDNMFFNIYTHKGSLKNEYSANQPPKYIYLDKGNEVKAELLYRKAKEIWINKYPEYYNAYYNNNMKENNKKGNEELIPANYPVYINTGNPEYDSSVFDKAKKEWTEKYPEEYNRMSGISFPSKHKKE